MPQCVNCATLTRPGGPLHLPGRVAPQAQRGVRGGHPKRLVMSMRSEHHDLVLLGHAQPSDASILTQGALAFVAALNRRFRPLRNALLAARVDRQARFDRGELPAFLAETEHIREAAWQVAPIVPDLRDRRVEITGPVDRKMLINALNSGAKVFMADFEDATAPTWANLIDGQQSLYDAVRRTIELKTHEKTYRLHEHTATLMVRPRGWHLPESHVLQDGEPIVGALLDFGLFFYHNAVELVARGSGPYFYLPKLQSHLEARLWNDIFVFAQAWIGLPVGTIRATVLIETLPAAFEMDEILWELREHSAGLNCGRWDYIFSYIKTLRAHAECVTPDRRQMTMTQPNMAGYARRLIQICHRRGIHAMGGMAAQIPIKGDAAANEAALTKVRADKLREVLAGHDGTWVAHPALVPIAMAIFDEHMPAANQIEGVFDAAPVQVAELLAVPAGERSEEGLRENIRVGVQYLEAWLRGNGCVPLYHLMEDAATAEISRTQVWQWVRHRAKLVDGRLVDGELFRQVLHDEMLNMRNELGEQRFASGRYEEAAVLFSEWSMAVKLADFLTLCAYPYLVQLKYVGK